MNSLALSLSKIHCNVENIPLSPPYTDFFDTGKNYFKIDQNIRRNM